MLPYFESTVAFILAMYLFETYLSIRQHRRYKEKLLPSELNGIVSEDKFARSQARSIAWFHANNIHIRLIISIRAHLHSFTSSTRCASLC